MGNTSTLVQYPITNSIKLDLSQSLTILSLSLVAGLLVRYLYLRFAQSYSSKSSYGDTLLMVTVCVAGLIAVVKSSLALSLGLVGALSVVRFRTAVKEPYTLSYILYSVCLGISIGASQYLFTLLIAITGFLTTLISYRKSNGTGSKKIRINDIDTINIVGSNEIAINNALNLLASSSNKYTIKTISNSKGSTCNATVGIQIESNEIITELLGNISSINGIINVTFYNDPS